MVEYDIIAIVTDGYRCTYNCLLDEYNLNGSKVDLDLERKFHYRRTRIVFEKYIS